LLLAEKLADSFRRLLGSGCWRRLDVLQVLLDSFSVLF
jgi:hypothetical protein